MSIDFVKKSKNMCGGGGGGGVKLVPDPFLQNQNWTYLSINSLKFDSLFLLYGHVESTKIYQN